MCNKVNHLGPLSAVEWLDIAARGEISDTPVNIIHDVQPLRDVLLHHSILLLLLLLIHEQSMSEHKGRCVVWGLRSFSINFSEQVVPVIVLQWHDNFININHSDVIVSEHKQLLKAPCELVEPVDVSIEAIIEGHHLKVSWLDAMFLDVKM